MNETPESGQRSLADAAAAWVPPWERDREPALDTPEKAATALDADAPENVGTAPDADVPEDRGTASDADAPENAAMAPDADVSENAALAPDEPAAEDAVTAPADEPAPDIALDEPAASRASVEGDLSDAATSAEPGADGLDENSGASAGIGSSDPALADPAAPEPAGLDGPAWSGAAERVDSEVARSGETVGPDGSARPGPQPAERIESQSIGWVETAGPARPGAAESGSAGSPKAPGFGGAGSEPEAAERVETPSAGSAEAAGFDGVASPEEEAADPDVALDVDRVGVAGERRGTVYYSESAANGRDTHETEGTPVASEPGGPIAGRARVEGPVVEPDPALEAVSATTEPDSTVDSLAASVVDDGAVAARTPEEKPAEPPPMSEAELRGALEAIMLVVDEPVGEIMLAQVLEQPVGAVQEALLGLADDYTRSGRGFELRRAAGGWRLYTRGDYASYVERFVLDGQQVRLTQASLETLAVVAYKQPVSRSRISAIRGVNCDAVVRTLVSRGLIEECGTEPESGAHLYRTTTLFLEKLGLDNVSELPPLAPFLPDEIDEIADAQHR